MRKVIVASMLTAVAVLASASPALAVSPGTATAAYHILVRDETRIAHLKVSLAARSATVGKLLAPSLQTAQSAYKTGTIGEVQGDDLVDEASVQYVFYALKPVEEVYLARDTAMEKLNIPAVDKRGFATDASLIRASFALNTRSDLARWQSAGWSPAAEPAGTKRGAAIASGKPGGATPTITLTWLNRALTVAQADALSRISAGELAHATKLETAARADLKRWLAEN